MDQRKSLVEEAWEDPEHSVGMAAAELAMDVRALLQRAFNSRPDVSHEDIGSRLNVSADRIREILSDYNSDIREEDDERRNSEGNLMIASLAKTLYALGYKLDIKVVAADEKANAALVNNPTRRRLRRLKPENLSYDI
jgi:hypothetical protein